MRRACRSESGGSHPIQPLHTSCAGLGGHRRPAEKGAPRHRIADTELPGDFRRINVSQCSSDPKSQLKSAHHPSSRDDPRHGEEASVTGNNVFAVTAIAAALGVCDADPATARGRGHSLGAVLPCSLSGVNPVYHRQIFDDPAVARSYGFVRGPDQVWRVASNCRNSLASPGG